MLKRIHYLIIKQLISKLSAGERLELEDFKARSPAHKQVVENLCNPSYLREKIAFDIDVDYAWERYKRRCSG